MSGKAIWITVGLIGLLAVGVALIDGTNAASRLSSVNASSNLVHASLEVGIYMLGLGGVGMIAAAVSQWRGR